jgi:histidine triad (HIT) family protein
MADDAELEKLKNMSPEELLEYQKKNCIFCYISSGKIPAKKVYEDEKVLAILDKNPATEGHLLLLPREHYSIMPQVPADVLEHFFIVAQSLAKSQLKAYQAQGVSIFVANGQAAGQRAPHFMIHLIPRKDGDNIGLKVPQNKITEEVAQQVGKLLEPKVKDILGYHREPPKEQTPLADKKEKPAATAEATDVTKRRTGKTEKAEEKIDEKKTDEQKKERISEEHKSKDDKTRDNEEKRKEDQKKDEQESQEDSQAEESEEQQTEEQQEEESIESTLNDISKLVKGWR